MNGSGSVVTGHSLPALGEFDLVSGHLRDCPGPGCSCVRQLCLVVSGAGRVSAEPSFSMATLRVEDDGFHAPGVDLFECSLCAALVEDTGRHAAWHEEAAALGALVSALLAAVFPPPPAL